MKKPFLKISFSLLLIAMLGLAACNNESSDDKKASDTSSTASNMKHAMATVTGIFEDTAVNGTVSFDQQADGKVKMHLELMIPAKANDSVAVHIHENAACGDMGKAAGGHWNPTNEMHGKWGGSYFHSGDIGNIGLDAEGKGSLDMETDRWSIGGNSTTDILNHSIIVHGGHDDYVSQPAGNSGVRIGCGIIKESTNKM